MNYLKYMYPLMVEAGEGSTGLSEEDIAAAFSSNSEDTPDIDMSKFNPGASPKDTPPANEFTPSPFWDTFKSDANFKLPEGLTKENEQELLSTQFKTFYGAQNTPPVLHPLAQQIQDIASKNPDITLNEIVGSIQSEFIDVSKMNVDEKLTFDLLSTYGKYDEKDNPDGLTDEDIATHIGKMTKIEKQEASKIIDNKVKAYNDEIVKSYQDKRKEEFLKNYDNVLAENDKILENIKKETSSVDKLFGVPVNQDQLNGYLEEFKTFITPDKETGLRGLDSLLSNDTMLFKAFVLLAKIGEEGVMETITKGRESNKEEIFKKFQLSPNFSGSRDTANRFTDPAIVADVFSDLS